MSGISPQVSDAAFIDYGHGLKAVLGAFLKLRELMLT
jgi:hypothetical protein